MGKKTPFDEDPELKALYAEFVASFPGRKRELTVALRSGDREQLVKLLHTLAGALGTYLFLEMSELASKLEQNPEANGVVKLQDALQAAFDEFISGAGSPAPGSKT